MIKSILICLLLSTIPMVNSSTTSKGRGKAPQDAAKKGRLPEAILWHEPTDIESRDLRYGSGGPDHTPKEPFVFLNEDLEGTNPKFEVRDGAGVKWKVKLGVEARPEVAASRLVWAAGYFTPDNYFLPAVRVKNMPATLERGQELIGADGVIRGARFKRSSGIKKVGTWKWRKNPFTGTRELNGLRVLMALINNIDLKNVNNAVFKTAGAGPERYLYMVSDLGSSFSGAIWPIYLKGNLASYRESKFITAISADTVDLHIPTGPALVDMAHIPSHFYRKKLRWIGRDIPRTDARWIGEILSRLSHEQIHDAFRFSGHTPEEIRGYTDVLLKRIAALREL